MEDRAERVGNFAVLILPALHCSTPAVYRAWDEMNAKSRTADRDDVPIESIVARRRSAAELMPLLFNDLELPAFRLLPELAALRDECECLAGGAVRMTGSGAALFRLFDNRADAEQLADNITQHIGVQVIVAPLAGAAERGLGR